MKSPELDKCLAMEERTIDRLTEVEHARTNLTVEPTAFMAIAVSL